MSILTDRQIRQRCIRPTHCVIKHAVVSSHDYSLVGGAGGSGTIGGMGCAMGYRPTVKLTGNGILFQGSQSECESFYANNQHLRGAGFDMMIKEFDGSIEFKPMIEPFHPELIRMRGDQKIISNGLSSMGYDVSLASGELKLFTNVNAGEIDPMDIDVDKVFITPAVHTCPKKGLQYVLIPPNGYLLGYTREYFNMPNDVLAICLGKSTYARSAVTVNCTPIEPGFSGAVVMEIGNMANLPVRIYLEVGISQFLFLKAEEECEVSYATRGGKYQGQTGLTHAKV